MDKPTASGNGVQSTQCPHLVLTFDPRTYLVSVSGSVPNLEFGKYMLQVAMDQADKQIAARDKALIAVPQLVPAASTLLP